MEDAELAVKGLSDKIATGRGDTLGLAIARFARSIGSTPHVDASTPDPWKELRVTAMDPTRGRQLADADPRIIVENNEVLERVAELGDDVEELEKMGMPKLKGLDPSVGLVPVNGDSTGAAASAEEDHQERFARAPLEACQKVSQYINIQWDGSLRHLPIPPEKDEVSTEAPKGRKYVTGYDRYRFHHGTMKRSDNSGEADANPQPPQAHAAGLQRSSTLIFDELPHARKYIPGFKVLEEWAHDVVARSSGGRRNLSVYPHHLRQDSDHARFDFHKDDKSLQLRPNSVYPVLSLVVMINGAPSTMVVAGKEAYTYAAVGDAALFHSGMWHATGTATMSTEKLTFFFSNFESEEKKPKKRKKK